MRVILLGGAGNMGRVMLKTLEDRGIDVVAVVDRLPITLNVPSYQNILEVKERADIIVDFSHHSAIKETLQFSTSRKIPILIATTAQTNDEIDMIIQASKTIPIFFEHNLSMGIALLKSIATQVASALSFCDIEIIEIHHNGKKDKPSGTAKKLRDSILDAMQSKHNQNNDKDTLLSQNDDINIEYCKNNEIYNMEQKCCKNIPIHSIRIGNDVGSHEVIFDTGCERIVISHSAFTRTIYAEGAISAMRFLLTKQNGLYNMQDILD